MASSERAWWKEAVVYQIYPASFKDSDDDGWGDIDGIINKIPYIQSLGVDTIWLSPIYASPQKDMGYDVSDYRSIHAPYGTVEKVQTLIDELHLRQMRLLMDLVVSYTSDEHAWFKDSRSSPTNSKRDWYIWKNPQYDVNGRRKEPNNWKSIFGGSAWHFDETTGQYYLALFTPSQPDLNWSNAEMRETAYNEMRFWLDRGVDGFRIDSMNLMSKHEDLPDGKVINDEPYQSGDEFFAPGPRIHEYIREMREKVFDKYQIMTVGELGFRNDEYSVSQYVAKNRSEVNMVFTGDIVDMDFGPNGKYTREDFHPNKIRAITNKWQTAMPKFNGWNSIYLDNHDSGRSLSRYASDDPRHRSKAAKMLATYLLTLTGTPFLLAGQEIGMANLGDDYGIEAYIDIEGRNYYNAVLEARQADHSQMLDVLRELQLKARDHGRLPMQWDASANAGFTASDQTPWMTINKDYTEWNVASQVGDPDSVLSYYKTMLVLRKEHRGVFIYGQYEPIPPSQTGEMVLGYEKRCLETGETAIVWLNFGAEAREVSISKYKCFALAAANQVVDLDGDDITLTPFGCVVLIGKEH